MDRPAAFLAWFVLTVPAAADEVGGLVEALGAEEWSVREGATRKLVEFGVIARPDLRRALESADAEVVQRADRALRAIERRLKLYRTAACIAHAEERTGYVEKSSGWRIRVRNGWHLPAGMPILIGRGAGFVGRGAIVGGEPAQRLAAVDLAWTTGPIRPGDWVVGLPDVDREIRSCSGRPVEGTILAVHHGCDLVAIDLGAGSGVETGSRLATYREGRRLHDVVVSDLFADLAAARIDRLRHSKLPELRKDDVVVFVPDDR